MTPIIGVSRDFIDDFSSPNSEAANVTDVAGCIKGEVTELFEGNRIAFIKTGLFNKYIAELSLLCDN